MESESTGILPCNFFDTWQIFNSSSALSFGKFSLYFIVPGASAHHKIDDSANDKIDGVDAAAEESESLSDIDDLEVCKFSMFALNGISLYARCCHLTISPFSVLDSISLKGIKVNAGEF